MKYRWGKRNNNRDWVVAILIWLVAGFLVLSGYLWLQLYVSHGRARGCEVCNGRRE